MDAHPLFAFTTVATAPSPATSGTSLVVASGAGSLFANYPFNATISQANATRSQMATTSEIVRITGRSGDTLTIVRAQEGTSARTIVVGDEIAVGPTPKVFTDIETDLASAASQIALQAAQIECRRIADLGQYVCSGGAITVNGATAGSSAARLDMAAAVDFMATTELNLAGQASTSTLTAQPGLATANSTTVASGSNNVHTNTFAGSGVLSVASVTGFPTSGTLMVTHSGVVSVITYTNVSGSTFTGCTLANGTDIIMATSDTVVGTNADITNPRWAVIEITSSGVWTVNLGTAAATPAFPIITTTNTPHAFLYIPANAVSIDTALTTSNGNAKLIDARNVRTPHPARLLFTDSAATSVSPSSGVETSLLASTYTLPANSLNIGDTVVAEGSFRYINSTNASTLIVKYKATTGNIVNYTIPSMVSNASARWGQFRITFVVKATGTSTGSNIEVAVQILMSGASASTPWTNFDTASGSTNAGLDTTTNQVIDFTVQTSAASGTIALRAFTIYKFPA